MLMQKSDYSFTIFLSLCCLEGFNLISMDEFEKSKWFASGGYAK